MLKKIQEYIVDDYIKCRHEDCHNCKAYLVSYADDRPVCLALIIQEVNKSLKADLQSLLEKY